MRTIPKLSRELIEDLDKAYPNKLPSNLSFNEKDIAYTMGQRSVIDHLIFLLNNEDKEKGDDYEILQ